MGKSRSVYISGSKKSRKKHKRLDAISEEVYNKNRGVKIEDNEGGSRGEAMGNDSELRRSSRSRRAPVILDSSPPPSRKRRKLDQLGKKVRGGSGKKKPRGRGRGSGRGKLNNEVVEAAPSSSANSEEELGAWKSRLRSKSSRRGNLNLIGSGNRPSGKRKLLWDDNDGEDINSAKEESEDEMLGVDSDDVRGLKSTELDNGGASVDGEDESEDDHIGDDGLENGVNDASGDEGDGDCTPSTSGRVVGNEEIVDDSLADVVDKKSEGFTGIQPDENLNRIDSLEDNEHNVESSELPNVVEDAQNQEQVTEGTAAEDVEQCDAENEVEKPKEKDAKIKNEANMGDCNVTAGRIHRSRVKEGRRCGLCGGGTDGKPPKVTSNDSAGSDNEAYSGSSASEDCNYDPWDGFGDEAGWLGKLLGPINDRYGIAGIWVHQHCAVWSPEVYFAGEGCLKNIRAALCRGRALKCTRCGRPGATLGCRVDRCPRTYHLPCARASGCIFDHRKFLIACADHRYLFQPHGFQYAQRIKKLKAKKMKLELRKLSNDASRKDLEAEEKWLEKCGEDDEFLRRETKRLQRDLLRIAPVYIGGSHSEGENAFEGWESAAGLQDVIKCMKEVVILPLLYPEFFENMGITPPRGVLLHGYPGTGKTLLVRALIGSCARGDKRIAYFARKGADCLGKYVGDAERQLRLLFQVAEKSQPSIIFFDEIDGLAPVRTRQQDQTHSSVVSTLLALMDGLKSRGSVVVIGATNRPDAVDPALRRPGRFDREVYFPLPSMKDRAAILALHTRKWPKPVSGTLLEWIASRTVGFAGADLQALCAQAAVIALKRNCSWHQILACAGDNAKQGRRPQLPSFLVEERDWLEALSLAPPPCSRREAGMAANEVVGSPLHTHLIPFLLQPLISLMMSLYLDDRLWLPRRLVIAGESIKKAAVPVMEKTGPQSDKWWFRAQDMVHDMGTTKEIVRSLSTAGVVGGDASSTGYIPSKDTSLGDDGLNSRDFDFNPFGSLRNLCHAPSKKTGYRILVSGDPRSGQKHLASCLLHCFVGSIEMQKIDLATISQEGHGNLEQGISNILMRCASVKLCALFMPRIDLWAIQPCPSMSEDVEASTDHQSSVESSSISCQIGLQGTPMPSGSELTEVTEYQDVICGASQIWRSFVEQLECIHVSSSLIILATSELPSSALPQELRQFFGCDLLNSEGSVNSENGTPRFSVEVKGEFDRDKLIHLSALDVTKDLIRQFVQLVHTENHSDFDATITNDAEHVGERDVSSHRTDLKSTEEPKEKQGPAESSISKSPVLPVSRNVKGKSSLMLAITAFGYQILRYPHFAELCWVTSKVNKGPSADIRGPWKGWPFNSCIVRPCKLMSKESVACITNNGKGKDQFTLVRGLTAVGLSAYRGTYTSPTEVSLEVRKVLELLIEEIASRIQAGKDRCQYIRLLSQVAYLEDMVNNWSYSLRSFDTDAQTSVSSKLNGAQSEALQPPVARPLEVGEEITVPGLVNGGRQGSSAGKPAIYNTPGPNPMQVEAEPNVQGSGFRQPQVEDILLEDHTADLEMRDIAMDSDDVAEAVNMKKHEASAQKVLATNQTGTSTYSAEAVPIQGNGSPKEVLSGRESIAGADLVDPVIDQPCSEISKENCTGREVSERKHLEDIAVTVGHLESTQESNQSACVKSLGQPTAGACYSEKIGNTDLHVSNEFCSQSIQEPYVENEISAQLGKDTLDLQLKDSRTSETRDLLSKSEVNCSYSCCIGCFHTLYRLVKKIIDQEWKLSSSCCTIEDVHDLVLTLSSSLCSTIRNLCITKGCNSSENGLRSRKLECQCGSSGDTSDNLRECICHSGKEFSGEVDFSSFNQPGSNLTYNFRDGILVSANSVNEFPFHCKYDTLCLCSLIELVVGIKQPID